MKFIILNGPSGVGKTTASASLLQLMPLAYHARTESIRRNIGQLKKFHVEATELAYEAHFRVCELFLSKGHDVIYDRTIRDEARIEGLLALARKYNAEVFEFFLLAPKDVVLGRVHERGFDEKSLLTPEIAERFWHEIEEFKIKRKNAICIQTGERSPDEVVAEIKKHIGI